MGQLPNHDTKIHSYWDQADQDTADLAIHRAMGCLADDERHDKGSSDAHSPKSTATASNRGRQELRNTACNSYCEHKAEERDSADRSGYPVRHERSLAVLLREMPSTCWRHPRMSWCPGAQNQVSCKTCRRPPRGPARNHHLGRSPPAVGDTGTRVLQGKFARKCPKFTTHATAHRRASQACKDCSRGCFGASDPTASYQTFGKRDRRQADGGSPQRIYVGGAKRGLLLHLVQRRKYRKAV